MQVKLCIIDVVMSVLKALIFHGRIKAYETNRKDIKEYIIRLIIFLIIAERY